MTVMTPRALMGVGDSGSGLDNGNRQRRNDAEGKNLPARERCCSHIEPRPSIIR
jgi:hypothetical protein